MTKKYLLAWLAVFLLWMTGSFLIHGVLLHADYAALSSIYRTETESQQYFPILIAAHVLQAAAFVWIYARGISDAPWIGQGLRFGLAAAFVTIVPTYMIYYAVQPIPGTLVVRQIVGDGILVTLLGVVAASFHRDG